VSSVSEAHRLQLFHEFVHPSRLPGRKKVLHGHVERFCQIEQLLIIDEYGAIFDLRKSAAADVEACKLEFDRKFGLRPALGLAKSAR
jgi:hypothetical protein